MGINRGCWWNPNGRQESSNYLFKCNTGTAGDCWRWEWSPRKSSTAKTKLG